MLLGTVHSAAEKFIQCNLEWKTNELQHAYRWSALNETDLEFSTCMVLTTKKQKCRKCW